MGERVPHMCSSYRQPSVAIALHDGEAVWGSLRVLNLVNLIKLRGLGIKSHHGDKNILPFWASFMLLWARYFHAQTPKCVRYFGLLLSAALPQRFSKRRGVSPLAMISVSRHWLQELHRGP
mgnify:CR=1 FL=1